MGEENHVMNRLLEKPSVFADFVNGTAFEGRQILRPEGLSLVSNRSGILYVNREGMKRTLERNRDVCMRSELDIGVQFAVFACENQSYVDYGMPVRNMLYDALDYMEQMERLKRRHEEGREKLRGNELLSGVRKTDRIIPVITTVLYLGKEEWDGSRSLYEMMGLEENSEAARLLGKYLPDYKLNIVHAAKVENTKVFRTGLQQLFDMLKYNSNKTKLYEYVKKNRNIIRGLDRDMMSAMITLLGEQTRLGRLLGDDEKKGEEKSMCKAIDDLIEDGRIRGREEGSLKKLISQVQKKISKEIAPEEIAEILEESAEQIQPIYDLAAANPGWDVDRIFEAMRG